jgi:large subunit ribosomal protein L7e
MQTVSEIVLKRRKVAEKHTQQQRLDVHIARKLKPMSKKKGLREQFKRAEEFVAEHRSREISEKKVKRITAKPLRPLPPQTNETVTFIVRTKPVKGVSPKIRAALVGLRMNRINNGVFVRLDQKTRGRMRIAENFVQMGQPSFANVKDLIYKRAFAKVDGKHIPLSDNRVIEAKLGDIGIVCVEDLVAHIYNVGPHFDRVTKFLWPIRFLGPKVGVKSVASHYTKEKEDPLESPIDKFIRQMN